MEIKDQYLTNKTWLVTLTDINVDRYFTDDRLNRKTRLLIGIWLSQITSETDVNRKDVANRSDPVLTKCPDHAPNGRSKRDDSKTRQTQVPWKNTG